MMHWPLLFLFACGLDATTTHVGLVQGGREQWLPTQQPVVADALIAGQCAGVWALSRHIAERGHPTVARVVLAIGSTVHVSAGLTNLRQEVR